MYHGVHQMMCMGMMCGSPAGEADACVHLSCERVT